LLRLETMPSSTIDAELNAQFAPSHATACTCAIVVEAQASDPIARVFGLTARERLLRSFERSELELIERGSLSIRGNERVIALSANYFYDDRLIVALIEHESDLLLVSNDVGAASVPVALVGPASHVEALIPTLQTGKCSEATANASGFEKTAPTDVVPAYDPKLRKHAPPFILPADPARAGETQERIFSASYKGVTDFVTKWVWPLPARIVTGWCAQSGISPNAVTTLSYVMALVALVAFWQGDFGGGLLSAWIMTFLDTVDGKLARVTLTSSKLGDFLDHGLDLIHPPFWWAAWGAGLAGPGVLFGAFDFWVAIIFGGYIVGRLLEGVFILAFGQEMFTWQRFDYGFRLVIARRNPNLVLLSGGLILGRPDLGFIAVGIWTICCILIQCVRIAQATALKMRGEVISPYAHRDPAAQGTTSRQGSHAHSAR